MRILLATVLLFCGCLADKEQIGDNYANLLSDQLIQKIEKRLQQWNLDDTTSQDPVKASSSKVATSTGKLTCHFTMQENTIIRTKDSLGAGATYQSAPSVSSKEECRQECCKLGTKCTLAVYKDKTGEDACYLFDCGSPNVCNFSTHAGYVSMHVTQWLDDQHQIIDQHEDALEQLKTDPSTPASAPPKNDVTPSQNDSNAILPYNVHVVEISSNSIKLAWESSAEVFSVHVLANGGAEDSYVVQDPEMLMENLTPHTNYTFYVVAYTPTGASTSSARVMATTKDDVPSTYPKASITAAGTALNVSWMSLPASEARGLVTQYKIVYKKQGTQQAKEVTVHGNLNEFLIKGVEPGSSYEVRVEAATRAGFAQLGDGGWLTVQVPNESLDKPCSKFQFACTSGVPRCIAIYDACDSVAHCSDGSDEQTCGNDDSTSDGGDQRSSQGGGGGSWKNNRKYVQQQQQQQGQQPANYQGQDYQQAMQQPNQQRKQSQQQAWPQQQQLANNNNDQRNYGQQAAPRQKPQPTWQVSREEYYKQLGQAGPQSPQAKLARQQEERQRQQDAQRPQQLVKQQQRYPTFPTQQQLVNPPKQQPYPSYGQQPRGYQPNQQQVPQQVQSPNKQQNVGPSDSLAQLPQQLRNNQQQSAASQNMMLDRQVAAIQSGGGRQQSNSQGSYQNGYEGPQQQQLLSQRKPEQPVMPVGPQQQQLGNNGMQSSPVQQGYQNVPQRNMRPQNRQPNMQAQVPQQTNDQPQWQVPVSNSQAVYDAPKPHKVKAQMPPQPAATLQKMQATKDTHMGRDGVPVSELHDHSNSGDVKHSGPSSGSVLGPSASDSRKSPGMGNKVPSGKGKSSNGPQSDDHDSTQINYSDGGTIYTHRKEGPAPKAKQPPTEASEASENDYNKQLSQLQDQDQLQNQLQSQHQSLPPSNQYQDNDRSNYLNNYRQNLYRYGYNRGKQQQQQPQQTNSKGRDDNSYFNLSPNYGHQQKPYPYPQYDNSIYNYIMPNTNTNNNNNNNNNNDFDYDYNGVETGHRVDSGSDSNGAKGDGSKGQDSSDKDSSGQGNPSLKGNPQGSKSDDSKSSDSSAEETSPNDSKKTAEVTKDTKTDTKPATETPSVTEKPVPVPKKKDEVGAEVEIPAHLLKVDEETKKTKLQNIRFNQTAVLVLALGLSITALLLIFAGCRLRTVKRRLRKGRPLNSNEADYLINGMYL